MEHTLDIHEQRDVSVLLCDCGNRNVQHKVQLRDREATVRGYHVYQDSWDGMQLSRIGEQLPCTREPGKRKDPFAVAVVRSSVTVSQLRLYECARQPALLV